MARAKRLKSLAVARHEACRLRVIMPRLAPTAFTLTIALLACGSSGLDRSIYTTNVCTGNAWSPLAGAVPAVPGTYVALVIKYDAGPQSKGQVTSSVGTACASAPDAVACNAALASASAKTKAWSTERCGGAGCNVTQQYFVTEKGGVVTVIETPDALRAAIAPVDGAAEAVLLAVYSATDPNGMDCSQAQARPVASSGWEVFLGDGDGKCSDRRERRMQVTVDGAVSTIEDRKSVV